MLPGWFELFKGLNKNGLSPKRIIKLMAEMETSNTNTLKTRRGRFSSDRE